MMRSASMASPRHSAGQAAFRRNRADLLAFFGEAASLSPIMRRSISPSSTPNWSGSDCRRWIRPDDRYIGARQGPVSGLPNSLDALCRRFEIDLSARTTHNALLDCKLLADVYVELTGGRHVVSRWKRVPWPASRSVRPGRGTRPSADRTDRVRARRARGVCCPVERSALALRVIFAGLKHRRAAQTPHFRRTHAGTRLAIASAWTSTPPSPVHASTPSFGLST